MGIHGARQKATKSSRFDNSDDQRLVDINNDGYLDLVLFGNNIASLANADVFPCSCSMSSFGAATFLKAGKRYGTEHFDARQNLNHPIIAQFDTGFGVPLFSKIARLFGKHTAPRTCYCAVVRDLNKPWIPSIGRAGRYASSCVGLCGAQCGKDDAGLTTDFKRFKSLIIHDVCQAFIGSQKSILTAEGMSNACGDEGLRGRHAAAATFLTQQNHCQDGPVPASHIPLIPPEFLPSPVLKAGPRGPGVFLA